jgi:hypothetical protein
MQLKKREFSKSAKNNKGYFHIMTIIAKKLKKMMKALKKMFLMIK